MASRDYIHESDDIYVPTSPRSRRRLPASPFVMGDPRIERLASDLQGTNRNLQTLDVLLDDFKDVGRNHRSAVDKLRTDLHHTTEELQNERSRTSQLLGGSRSLRQSDLDIEVDEYDRRHRKSSPVRDYDSDVESPSSRRHKRASVRFADDMNRELHVVHQSVRDLSQDHLKLEESFTEEVDRRDRNDREYRRRIGQLSDGMKQSNRKDDTISLSVDKRLQVIHDELKSERQYRDRHREDDGALSSELKQALHQPAPAAYPSIQTAYPVVPLGYSAPPQPYLGSHLPYTTLPPPPQPYPAAIPHAYHPQPAPVHQQPAPVSAQPLQNSIAESEHLKYRNQYLQSESQKNRIESELDNLQRRFDQTDGSRSALQQQVDDLRNQVMKSEQDKARIKMQVDEDHLDEEIKEKRRKRTVEEEKKQEQQGYEAEIQELRAQLSRSMGAVGEVEEMRRTVDRSERQRQQLSDHIEGLAKDLENREKQTAKVITQLQEVSEKYQDSERQKNQFLAQLEDNLRRLKETQRDLDRTADDLKVSTINLSDSERKRDDYKDRAHDTVKQWKMKVKQLERDLDRREQDGSQVLHRNELLVRELDSSRSHIGSNGIHVETLKRELSDTLAMRASQDEQLKLKDIEVNELKSFRLDLEQELRDARTVADKLESELHMSQTKQADTLEEKRNLEDRLATIEAQCLVTQDQMQQTTRELHELTSLRAKLTSQWTESDAHRQELELVVHELQQRGDAVSQECELAKRELHNEREMQEPVFEKLKKNLDEAKKREAQITQELTQRLKRDRAEYEAAIEALKLEVSEERSSVKLARRKEEKRKAEMERLESELRRYEEENDMFVKKLEKVKLEYVTQTQLAENDLSSVGRIEDQLFEAQKYAKNLERQQASALKDLCEEIDAVMEMASIDSVEKYNAINSGKESLNDLNHLIAEMKSKLKWLHADLRDRIKQEGKLRRQYKDALNCNENDRIYLMSELTKKEEALDDLATTTQELADREMQNHNTVETLQDEIYDLSDQLELQKIKENSFTLNSSNKQHVIDEMDDYREAVNERERIHERYLRLQETVKSLHEDLHAVDYPVSKARDLHSDDHVPSVSSAPSTPKRNRRVRIQESPPRLERSPVCHSSPNLSHTPPPLTLSDDEFQKKFLPRSPELTHDIHCYVSSNA